MLLAQVHKHLITYFQVIPEGEGKSEVIYIYVHETRLHLYISALLISGVALERLWFPEENIFLQAVKY